jgi:hypothetical protein
MKGDFEFPDFLSANLKDFVSGCLKVQAKERINF